VEDARPGLGGLAAVGWLRFEHVQNIAARRTQGTVRSGTSTQGDAASPREQEASDRPAAASASLEEPGARVVEPAHRLVVEHETLDPAVLREDPGLRLDLLGGEHAAHGSEQGVPPEELEVPRELLDAVDVPTALDLVRDRR